MLSRRALLRGTGAAAIGLPWLEASSPPSVAAAAPPVKRFVVMFTPNGTLAEQWIPSGNESEFSLSPILSPLEPHQQDLVVVSGLDQSGAGGDGHQNGIGGMLTGAALNPGPFGGTGARPAGWASGPSVDQRIASELGRQTRLQSLQLGVQVGTADTKGRMCYRAANQPLPPQDDPILVYNSVFSDLHTAPEVLQRERAHKRSILDGVAAQYESLLLQVSSQDRVRLDRHLSAVRDLEQRLEHAVLTASATCNDPEVPSFDAQQNDAYPEVGRLQIELLCMALACDVTRVTSLQWSRSASPTRFTWLGISQGHHDLSHANHADAQVTDNLVRLNQWYMQELAALLQALRAVPDADGTLLDNTLVFVCNELAAGDTHSRKDAGYLLAGKAGGALRTGRFVQVVEDRTHNDLLVSLLQLMGLSDTSFGNPEWCQGALSELL